MAIRVEVPDVGIVEFPDSMSPDDIQKAIRENVGPQADLWTKLGQADPSVDEDVGTLEERDIGDRGMARNRLLQAAVKSLEHGPTQAFAGGLPNVDLGPLGRHDLEQFARSYQGEPEKVEAFVLKRVEQFAGLFLDPINALALMIPGGIAATFLERPAMALAAQGSMRLARALQAGGTGAAALGTLDLAGEAGRQYEAGKFNPGALAMAAGKGSVTGLALGGPAALSGPVQAFLGEVAVFGTMSPALEGRMPTWDDYLGALDMIIALRTMKKLTKPATETLNAIAKGLEVTPEGMKALERELTPEVIQEFQAEIQRDPQLSVIKRAWKERKYDVQEMEGLIRATPAGRQLRTNALLRQVPDDMILEESMRDVQPEGRRGMLQEELRRREGEEVVPGEAPVSETFKEAPEGALRQTAKQAERRRRRGATVRGDELKPGDQVEFEGQFGQVVARKKDHALFVADDGRQVRIFDDQMARLRPGQETRQAERDQERGRTAPERREKPREELFPEEEPPTRKPVTKPTVRRTSPRSIEVEFPPGFVPEKSPERREEAKAEKGDFRGLTSEEMGGIIRAEASELKAGSQAAHKDDAYIERSRRLTWMIDQYRESFGPDKANELMVGLADTGMVSKPKALRQDETGKPIRGTEEAPAEAKPASDVTKERKAGAVEREAVKDIKEGVEESARDPREIKKEIVSELEAAIEAAPAEADISSELFGIRKRRKGVEGIAAGILEEAGVKKLTFEIPGDGTFEIWNTKEALATILKRAKKTYVPRKARAAKKVVKKSEDGGEKEPGGGGEPEKVKPTEAAKKEIPKEALPDAAASQEDILLTADAALTDLLAADGAKTEKQRKKFLASARANLDLVDGKINEFEGVFGAEAAERLRGEELVKDARELAEKDLPEKPAPKEEKPADKPAEPKAPPTKKDGNEPNIIIGKEKPGKSAVGGVKKAPKDFTGDPHKRMREEVESRLGRKLNEDEGRIIDNAFYEGKTAARFFGDKDFSLGTDFLRTMRQSTAVPKGARERITEIVEERVGGVDIPVIEVKSPGRAKPEAKNVLKRGASTDIARPAMNHVYLNKNGDLVATDGHAMLIVRKYAEPGNERYFKPEKSGFIERTAEQEGPFPDYEQVIPKKTELDPGYEISREDASAIAQTIKQVKKSGWSGELHRVEMPVGAERACFNAEYLQRTMDSLVDLGVEKIRIAGSEENTAERALILSGTTAEGKEALALLMPLKVEKPVGKDLSMVGALGESGKKRTFNPDGVDRAINEKIRVENDPTDPMGSEKGRDEAVDFQTDGDNTLKDQGGIDPKDVPPGAGDLQSFPGPMHRYPGALWAMLRKEAPAAQKALLSGKDVVEDKAVDLGADVRGGMANLRFRLLGDESVERMGGIRSSEWKNAEEVLSQTREGGRVYRSCELMHDKTAANVELHDRRFKDIKKGIEGGKRPSHQKREWEKILDYLDTGAELPKHLEPYGRDLRKLMDDLHAWAVDNGVKLGYKENYLHHLFDGDYWLYVDGKKHALPFKSLGDALVELNTVREGGGSGAIRKEVFLPPYEGTTLARKGYWRLVSELKKFLEVDALGEVDVVPPTISRQKLHNLMGEKKIARPQPHRRFFAAQLKRMANNPNFTTNPDRIFRAYIYGIVRKVHQDRMWKDVQTQVDKMPDKDFALKRWILDKYMPRVLSHPTAFERALANTLKTEPFKVRRTIGYINGVQFVWDLGYSISSITANGTQTLMNTVPIIGIRNLVYGDKMWLKSLTDAKLTEEIRLARITDQISPVTHKRITHPKNLQEAARKCAEPLGGFTTVEERNRVSSYFGAKRYAGDQLIRASRGDGSVVEAVYQTMESLAKKAAVSLEAAEKRNTSLHEMVDDLRVLEKKIILSTGKAKNPKHNEMIQASIRRSIDTNMARAAKIYSEFPAEFGRLIANRTQFKVNRANLPGALHNGAVRLVFPYRAFFLNQLNYTWKTLKPVPEYRGGGLLKRGSWRRAGVWDDPVKALKHAGIAFALAGTMGSPVLTAAFLAIRQLYMELTGTDLQEELRKYDIDRGLLGKLGMDISGNIALNMPEVSNLDRMFETSTGRFAKLVYHAAKFSGDGYDIFEQRRLVRDALPASARRILDAGRVYQTGEIINPIKGDLIDTVGDDAYTRFGKALTTAIGFGHPDISFYYDEERKIRKRVMQKKDWKADFSERLAEAIKSKEPETAEKVITEAVDNLGAALRDFETAKSRESRVKALGDLIFWYQALELQGQSLENALERKLMPRRFRQLETLPIYARPEAAEQLLLEE